MSAADGRVVGLTRVVDNGSPSKRWNLVVASDGYRAGEMARFAAEVQSFADHLFTIAPFDDPQLGQAINIYRLDVESTDSGADKPACGVGGATGTFAATYFDSTFCFDGRTRRLLYGNERLAKETVRQRVPLWHQILILVNDSERGGGGANVGWLSNGEADWRDTAIHEMGHSAFDLADEYGYGGPATWPGGDPGRPNVSDVADPASVKWSQFVTAGPAVPTRANPTCRSTDPGPSPVGPGIVGTFEDAGHSHCGLYRPTWTCKMRHTTDPFCPICEAEIIRTLRVFAAP